MYMDDPNADLLSKLPTRLKKALYKEIAQYGERAYRRGFQQAVVMRRDGYCVNGNFASTLRHKSYDKIYEVYEGNRSTGTKALLYSPKSILYRIGIETVGPLIHCLERTCPAKTK